MINIRIKNEKGKTTHREKRNLKQYFLFVHRHLYYI